MRVASLTLLGTANQHGSSSNQQWKRLVVVPLCRSLGFSWQQVSSHLNARNKTGYAPSTGEFPTLFLSANLTSRQAWGPETAIWHSGLEVLFSAVLERFLQPTIDVWCAIVSVFLLWWEIVLGVTQVLRLQIMMAHRNRYCYSAHVGGSTSNAY